MSASTSAAASGSASASLANRRGARFARVTAARAAMNASPAASLVLRGSGVRTSPMPRPTLHVTAAGKVQHEVERGRRIGGERLELVAGVAVDGQGEALAEALVEPGERGPDEIRTAAAVHLIGGDDEHETSCRPGCVTMLGKD